MIGMKTTIKQPPTTTTRDDAVYKSRSVKVSDPIHYRLRVLAAKKRMGIQEFIEKLLLSGLKRYEIAETKE
jgi:hypothetical protein